MRLVIILIAFLFVFAAPVSAVNITINSFPSDIGSLDQFQITASISGATNATNYLRIDLYKDGTSNYFGETFNGMDWIKGGDGKSYLPIEIQNSSASAIFQGRLGSPSTTDYPGPGIYDLRIRRYTASGNASNTDDQNPVSVQISFVFPTPTPHPISTPRVTLSPSPTPLKTSTPVPIKTVVAKTTQIPNLETTSTSDVLGATTSDPRPTPTSSPAIIAGNSYQRKFPLAALGLIFLGLVFVGVSCFIAFRERLR